MSSHDVAALSWIGNVRTLSPDVRHQVLVEMRGVYNQIFFKRFEVHIVSPVEARNQLDEQSLFFSVRA